MIYVAFSDHCNQNWKT